MFGRYRKNFEQPNGKSRSRRRETEKRVVVVWKLKKEKNLKMELAQGTDSKHEMEDTFHIAARPILLLAQIFSTMPLVGVTNSNPRHVHFSLVSKSTANTMLFLVVNSIMICSVGKNYANTGVNAKNAVIIIFYGVTQFACVLFALLAKHWPALIRYWTSVELMFIKDVYERPRWHLTRRLQLTAYIILALSLLEHLSYLSSATLSYRRAKFICAQALNQTPDVTFGEFMRKNYVHGFTLLSYNMFTGVCVLVLNVVCTFIWNFMEIFLVMISIGIAYRFEQITMRITKLVDQKQVPESTFVAIREHYVKMCELLDYVDDHLSGIILLLSINDLYFVCFQLLNIFNELRWPINYVYFWYSLLFLIGRCAYAFLTAASINDESKRALTVLRQVAIRSGYVEVERLMFHMATQTVALSGKKFYFLTRSLLLGMAGTIVTYELVLLQFDERSNGLPDLCSTF